MYAILPLQLNHPVRKENAQPIVQAISRAARPTLSPLSCRPTMGRALINLPGSKTKRHHGKSKRARKSQRFEISVLVLRKVQRPSAQENTPPTWDARGPTLKGMRSRAPCTRRRRTCYRFFAMRKSTAALGREWRQFSMNSPPMTPSGRLSNPYGSRLYP